jgi:H+/Cl- antiporter ClcA
MSQIKVVEKTRKRNPLLPVLGLLIAITLAVFSYAVEEPFIKLLQSRFPNAGLTQSADPFSLTRIGFTLAIWIFLLVIFSIIVAIAGGKSPDDAKGIIMPPRTQAERDKRYGGGDSN